MQERAQILRIIVVGSIHGKFTSLFRKIDDINQKHGPFELLLCPGRLFSDENPEWSAVVSGQLKCPVPMLVLGPQNSLDLKYYKNTDAATLEGLIAPNIYCLGLNGVHVTSSGLQIAFISFENRKDGSWGICKDSIYRIEEHMRKSNAFRGVDFFLTPIWPCGVLSGLSPNQFPNTLPPLATPDYGDETIAKLASILRPRYHLCAWDSEESFFYQRLPYRNYPLFSFSQRHLSFFVSLGAYENSLNYKDTYAMKVSPLMCMEYGDLCTSQFEATENPYPRYSSIRDAFKPTNLIKKSGPNGLERDFAGQSCPDCWFCLDNPNIQRHMIFYTANRNYLTLAKGGLVPFHILLCTISHIPCLAALDENAYQEMKMLKRSVKKMFRSEERSLVIFDRNYHSQHLQLQMIPIPKQNPVFLADVFVRHGKKYGMDFTKLGSDQPLSKSVSPETPYFYLELEDGIRLLHIIRGKIPIQFGREVLASPEVLSLRPERVDWKRCELSQQQECSQAKELEEKIKGYL